MATTLKKYGAENVKTNRFISIIDIDNIASTNVARKNGMSVLFKSEFMGMKVDVYGVDV